MTPSETKFITQERYVDNGDEWYDLTIMCNFNTPPPVLEPGRPYTVTAHMSLNGTPAQGRGGLGAQFWYAAQRGHQKIIEPRAVLAYAPGNPQHPGRTRMKWTITARTPDREGDPFDLYASLWHRPPCFVYWTYRAEYQRSPPDSLSRRPPLRDYLSVQQESYRGC